MACAACTLVEKRRNLASNGRGAIYRPQQQSKTMRAALFAPLLAGCLPHGASAAAPLKVFVFAGQCVAPIMRMRYTWFAAAAAVMQLLLSQWVSAN
eukprot:COSAG02_NODE_48905_length_330_cov_1.324675_1_plen_96_part_01